MRNRAILMLPTLALACSVGSKPDAGDPYEASTLAAYLQALPQQDRLSAGVPTADDTPGALTHAGDSVLAAEGVQFARAVNQPVRHLVVVLHDITAFPPTSYDATRREFLWGPWNNPSGVGKMALVVRENEPGSDFEYFYSLVRATRSDLSDASPVISGGSTPDAENPNHGAGVALWDLEANHDFLLAHDGSAERASDGRGRFVTLFGHRPAPGGDALFNVAVFRNFVPERTLEQAEAPAPLDVDYFYGRFLGAAGMRVDFVDSEVLADLCDGSADTCFEHDLVADSEERFDYNAFFVNRGLGRAEARLSEGDLNASVHLVECWSPTLDRTSFQIETDGAMVETMENGGCASPADQSPSELGLPELSDIEPAMLRAMTCAAEHGLIGCE
jgi:hypothetical protein